MSEKIDFLLSTVTTGILKVLCPISFNQYYSLADFCLWNIYFSNSMEKIFIQNWYINELAYIEDYTFFPPFR